VRGVESASPEIPCARTFSVTVADHVGDVFGCMDLFRQCGVFCCDGGHARPHSIGNRLLGPTRRVCSRAWRPELQHGALSAFCFGAVRTAGVPVEGRGGDVEDDEARVGGGH
jgi:hypothetical protein